MSWTRASLLLLTIALGSCEAIFPSGPSPDNCVVNPGLCDISLGQICNATTKRCTPAGACSAIAQCETAAAVECRSGQCVPCEANTQCQVWSTERKVSPALTICVKPTGAAGGTCGQCATKADCTANPDKAFCDPVALECRGCLLHSECDSATGMGDGICSRPNDYPAGLAMVGRCVPASSIAYLGNNPAGCETNSANPSSVSKPYCTLAVAMAAVGKSIIKVLPSGTPYPAIALTTQTVTLVGPGRDASPGAVFPSVDLNGTGTLTLSDVQVVASAGTAAVICRGNGKLNLIASSVSSASGQHGIDADSCTQINLERTRVRAVGRSGLVVGRSITDVTYRIVNNSFVDSGNGSNNVIVLGSKADGVFNYNTVTRNANSVFCSNGQALNNSILVKNNNAMPMGCSASGNSETSETITLDPALDPKLAADQAARTLCVDKGTEPLAGEVLTDFFGNMRPIGKARDKGFHELE